MSHLIMQLNQNSKDSDGSFAKTKSPKMKIALFYKPHVVNACFLFVIISVISFTPITTKASFFSDVTSFILGESVTADETILTPNSDQNSQNIPLLEASIDPDIKKTNQIDNSPVIQDDLFINSEFLFVPNANFEKSTISDQIRVYTVEEGDTLSGIADTFDVSVNTIRWENNISGQTVSVGQKLNILPVTGVKHIVKKGDTVNGIADKYEADSEDILVFNGILSGNSLKQGDILFIPNGIIKPTAPKTTAKTTSSTPSSSSSNNKKAPAGYYIRPAQGIITSPYGSRRGGFHYGVDIGNVRGTAITAAASGVVSKALSGCVEGRSSCGGRYGNYIVIEHPNGTSTMYAHLNSVNVKVGQSVSQGKKIGTLGNTGGSTGPHLHFEVRNANGSTMKPPVY